MLLSKKKILKMLVVPSLAFFISSCSLLGVHRHVENPKKPGTYPKETRQRSLLGAKTPLRDNYDVYHNYLRIQIDPAKKYLKGSVEISAVALTEFDSLQIDLYKNMRINSISISENGLSYHREEGAVFIKTIRPIHKDEHFKIRIDYEGNPVTAHKPPWDGGFTWKKDKNGDPWIGVSCETEGASLWWPCKDEMSDEADSTDCEFTVPSGLTAVSNGKLISYSSSASAPSVFHWHISYPINNYNVTVYIGKLQLLHDTFNSISGKTVDLNHYVMPWNYEKAKEHFQQLKTYLAFYEKMFGEYPWQRDGFKLVESPYEGMEHQSSIAYGNGYKNDYGYFDYIILHETAHEWWGNSVTAADLGDGWLHEGFATYCEALWVESVKGKDAYLNYLYFQRIFIMNKRPVVRKHNIRYFDYHDEDIYNKGSWILHTLRNTINDDPLFFDILKTFREENHLKQVYSQAFIDVVNRKTGHDYNWFFNQYLFRREAPILEYSWDGDTFYYRWTCTGDDFVLPINMTIGGKKIRLFPTTKVQSVKLSYDGKDMLDNQDELYFGNKRNKKLPAIFSSKP